MKVFISWSEAKSRAMAVALADALPVMVQAVEPFFSQEIEKGKSGDQEIHAALEGTGFGIICLTSDNLDSTWMHYEAGALAKSGERVWTLLLDISHADVPPPLSRFQHTLVEKDDFFRLVESINNNLPHAGDKALPPATLRTAFERTWPNLETEFEQAKSIKGRARPRASQRPDRELLEEILGVVRTLEYTRFGDWTDDADETQHMYVVELGSEKDARGALLQLKKYFSRRPISGLELRDRFLFLATSRQLSPTEKFNVRLIPAVIGILEIGRFATVSKAFSEAARLIRHDAGPQDLLQLIEEAEADLKSGVE